MPYSSRVFHPVPQQRIRDKVDECMSRRDYAGVERVLLYWLEEANAGNDPHGRLMVLSELVGHYRKTGEAERIRQYAKETIRQVKALDAELDLSGATAYVNVATALNSIGENEQAIELFNQARTIYEHYCDLRPALTGGLYNNMGLTLSALGRYDEALTVYHLALNVMEKTPDGKPEQAVTCLNMANALEAYKGMDAAEKEIFTLLDQAESLLSSPDIERNSYYAYVASQCAPTFEYYGYFAAADTLKKTAEAIYERT